MTPMELTDLDVLGIRLTDDFRIEYVIVDCKSGQRISTASRAFFLRGLMDYFGSERAYLVVQKPIPMNTQIITGPFKITPVDADTLAHMEKAFDAASAPKFLREEIIAKREELQNLSSVKGLEEALDYRKYYYWFYEDNRNLLNLPALAGRTAAKLSLKSRYHRFFIFDYLLLYTISLLRVCDYVMRSDLSQMSDVSGRYFFGGTTAMRERKAIFNILRTEIYPNLSARAKSRIRLEDLSLEPKYFNAFLEVIFRLLRRPAESRELLRYIYVVSMAQLNGRSPEYEELLGSFSEITRKLAEDVRRLFTAAADLDPVWLDPEMIADLSFSVVGTPEPAPKAAATSNPSADVQQEQQVTSSVNKSRTSEAVNLEQVDSGYPLGVQSTFLNADAQEWGNQRSQVIRETNTLEGLKPIKEGEPAVKSPEGGHLPGVE